MNLGLPAAADLTGSAGLPAVSCRDLAVHFRALDLGDAWRLLWGRAPVGEGFQALHGINLSVAKGEFLGVLGRNGAGKSTLLRALGGIYHPSRGVVALGNAVSAIYELGISGHELMTGAYFAGRWLELAGHSSAAIAGALPEIRAFTELEGYFDRPIYTYSTGMRARLFFAVATALPASVYLIDEVLSVGDDYFTAKCWRRLRRRLAAGASGVLATHDWPAVLRICDRACILDRGRMVDIGTAADVMRHYLQPSALRQDIARFVEPLPTIMWARAGETARWTVPFEVSAKNDVLLAVSIESFRRGYGWDHLLQLDPVRVASEVGRYDATITIPDLPLRRGRYTLSMGLSLRRLGVHSEFDLLDAREWLRGNHLTLEVEGGGGEAQTRIPMTWSARRVP